MKIIHTKVFNKEIVKEAMRRAVIVNNTPIIIIGERSLYDIVSENFKDWIDSEAVKAGLPIPEKDKDGDVIHYGFCSTGEFIKRNGES